MEAHETVLRKCSPALVIIALDPCSARCGGPNPVPYALLVNHLPLERCHATGETIAEHRQRRGVVQAMDED